MKTIGRHAPLWRWSVSGLTFGWARLGFYIDYTLFKAVGGSGSMVPAADRNVSIGVIPLSGRFNFSAFRPFRDRYEPMLENPALDEIHLDMREVSFIDSAALGMLLLLREKAQARGKRVHIRHCSDEVRKILVITNFDQLFELIDD